MQTEFVVPKRMDIIDERTLLAGMGQEREMRFEKNMDVTPWLKRGLNYVEIGKISLYDKYTYACGVYICR
jgi:hypothetical protein